MITDRIPFLITFPHPALEKLLELYCYPVNYVFKTYQNGEIDIRIKDYLENQNLLLIHFIDSSLHDSLMLLLMAIHAAKNQNANQVHVILPCLPYNRQSYIKTGHSPIALIAQLLESAGATSITTVDLHDPETINFFKIPVHHLSFTSTIVADIKQRNLSNYVIISPDAGGVARAKSLANQLQVPFVSLDKKRHGPGDSTVLGINGDVAGKLCLIFDDIIDSGNTLLKAVEVLLKEGAVKCEAYITHSFLTQETVKRIETSKLARLTLSDTCPTVTPLSDKIYKLSLNKEIMKFIKEIKNLI